MALALLSPCRQGIVKTFPILWGTVKGAARGLSGDEPDPGANQGGSGNRKKNLPKPKPGQADSHDTAVELPHSSCAHAGK